MKKVGLGIVGLGFVGKIHLRHALKMPGVDVVAVSDLSKKAQGEAKSAGVKKVFGDYKDLLKESDVDAVLISVPTFLHLNCARDAAEAGKSIFLEKPIARNVKEAEEIVAAAQRNSVKLMMGYQMRFHKSFIELKERMESRALGDVEVAYTTLVGSGPFFHRLESHAPIPVPDWWFNRELTGGGVFVDLGSHVINLFRWFFGEVTDIKGQFGHRFNLDFENSAICFAKFESGTKAVITTGYFSQAFHMSVEFFGSVDHGFATHLPGNRLVAAAQMLTTGISDFYRPHFDELQYFAQCIASDTSPSPSGQDGLRDIEAITRAYKNEIHLGN